MNIISKSIIKSKIKKECMKCGNRLPKKRFRVGDIRRDKLSLCSKKEILISDRDFMKCSDCTLNK